MNSILITLVILTFAMRTQAQQITNELILTESLRAFNELEAGQPSIGWIAKQNGAELAWNESYRLMAYVSMYEGTGDTGYLDKAIVHADAVLKIRDDQRGIRDVVRDAVLPAWSSTKYTDGQPYAWIVHAGMITYPMARLAYLIRKNPQLAKTYGEVATWLVHAVRLTVAGFDRAWRDGPGSDEGYYFGVAVNRPLDFNKQNTLGRTLVTLWLVTARPHYRARAEKLARYFKRHLRLENNRYLWPDDPHGWQIEDISHAAINIDFAFLCYRAGLVFTRLDMVRFVRTLKQCNRGSDGFADRVDGSGKTKLSPLMGLWAHLGFIDLSVRRELFSYLKNNWFVNNITGFTCSALLVETHNRFAFDEVVAIVSERSFGY